MPLLKAQKKNKLMADTLKDNQDNNENYLTTIPVLGYFFRKIKEYIKEIETTLKTGKETKSKIKKRYFLGGLFKIIWGKRFKPLK